MTVSPEQIRNPEYAAQESYWLNGFITKDGIEGGQSIINNIDDCSGNIFTLRQVQHEAKYSPDGFAIYMKVGQMQQVKIEQLNNKNKIIILTGYRNHQKRDSADEVFVFDLGSFISNYSRQEIFDEFPNGLTLPLSNMTETRRQKYNKFQDDWKKGKFDNFDLEKIKKNFNWQEWTKNFYTAHA